MKFNEIVTEILSYKTRQVTTKNGMFWSDSHLFTNLINSSVIKIQNKGTSDEALLSKQMLQEVLDIIVDKNNRKRTIKRK